MARWRSFGLAPRFSGWMGLCFGILFWGVGVPLGRSQPVWEPKAISDVPAILAQIDQQILHHQNRNEFKQVGRLLTEKAQVLNRSGHPRQALALLCGEIELSPSLSCVPETAISLARQHQDVLGQSAALGSLGTVYISQGRYEVGVEFLQASLLLGQEQEAPVLVHAALNNLGIAYSGLATRSYRYADLASQEQDAISAARFKEQAQAYDQEAINSFQTGLAHTQSSERQLQTQLNLLLPQTRQGQLRDTDSRKERLQALQARLSQQSDSADAVYGWIKLAKWQAHPQAMQARSLVACDTPISASSAASIIPTSAQRGQRENLMAQAPGQTSATALFQQAATLAQRFGSRSLQALTQGELGHLYECQGRYREALQLTQQAQLEAELSENRYRWDWQAGRILEALGEPQGAIEAYESAIQTVEALRGDLTASDRDLQLDFRDTVAVLYRQLAALQFAQTQAPTVRPAAARPRSPQLLQQSLTTLEKLHLSELQDYLGELCDFSIFDLDSIAQIDPGHAVISTMILSDRLVVVARFPDGQLQTHLVPVDAATLSDEVAGLRRRLEQRSDLAHRYRPGAEKFYDWLIRPFEDSLSEQQIETLLFVQDGILRSLPMAVLHDGQQFLVERYDLASTPSLALLNPRVSVRPSSVRAGRQVIAFGLTDATEIKPRLAAPQAETLLSQLRPVPSRQTQFASLPAVRRELEGIQAIVPQTQVFFNEEFTRDRLNTSLQQSAEASGSLSHRNTILHLATHARFSFDARNTFLVTGESNPVTLNELYQMIQQARSGMSTDLLDLIVLTGCETAVGSDRDALGIAGMALQAGARSALASLWQVDDAATAQLVVSFYEQLFQGQTKANALQLAQQRWLQKYPTGLYSHPGYWAALVLVGQSGQ